MISSICWEDLVAAAGECCGDAQANRRITSLAIDSRRVERGSVFFALPGMRVDGHDYLDDVKQRGAVAAVVSRRQNCDIEQLLVDDPAKTLATMAAANRAAFDGKVVAITGSVGKTTCKNIVSTILSQVGPVCATWGNQNNELGVPLTLQRLSDEDRYAVLEMGAAKRGDIAYLTDMAQPDVALVTKVAPAHLAGFGSVAEIASTKGEIYSSLRDGGAAIINLDEPYAVQWLDQLRAANANIQIITFSRATDDATVSLLSSSMGRKGLRLEVAVNASDGQSECLNLAIPLLGLHNIDNVLAAIAVCLALSIELPIIERGLSAVSPEMGRLSLVDVDDQLSVIDDTYNASPESVKAAIDVLVALDENRSTVLVLGDMAELGTQADGYHRELGEYAARAGVDTLLAVGEFRNSYVDGFKQVAENSTAKAFDDKNAAIEYLVQTAERATILVKGSRSAKMEEIVKGLKGAMQQRGVAQC